MAFFERLKEKGMLLQQRSIEVLRKIEQDIQKITIAIGRDMLYPMKRDRQIFASARSTDGRSWRIRQIESCLPQKYR